MAWKGLYVDFLGETLRKFGLVDGGMMAIGYVNPRFVEPGVNSVGKTNDSGFKKGEI